jgi:hypothetical protein
LVESPGTRHPAYYADPYTRCQVCIFSFKKNESRYIFIDVIYLFVGVSCMPI